MEDVKSYSFLCKCVTVSFVSVSMFHPRPNLFFPVPVL